ncbi:hypothetical protein SIAM614_30151 [Stappia aggregata IAM 12614]|uniref:Uncharacterized protein n=1 Tax=Roseibium aggregatum (strain ATCC 25650 / DSM 13394 / JCM 20685 / NBRC 16684 / NCIMB 2208 / IAM 12614 / B1) TaxID=384765 RepID=A0P051_ROSAI|nr:hypothetical protein [Roseibium aggregatum]EAV41459.1 hypothetical protein SIAM614_30151 [Stappia aggregata IAM 12614] [Roseibium aggregatum IAM 12614]
MLNGKIALDDECHKQWLELQLDLIERPGKKIYNAKLVSFGEDHFE